MKLVLNSIEKVCVLTKSETPWEMNGRKGISYRVGIRANGDIEKIKVSEDLYKLLEIDKNYQLSGSLSMSNNNVGFLFDRILDGGQVSVDRPTSGK